MRLRYFALIFAVAACDRGASPKPEPPEPANAVSPGGYVQTEMRNVRFHATESVVFDIERLRGELVRTNAAKPPDTEDPTSYEIRLSSAELLIPEDAIAAAFEDWVLAGVETPVQSLRVDIDEEHIVMRGRMKPGVPFEIVTNVELVDGTLHVTPVEMRTLGIGIEKLSKRTGIKLRRIIGSHPDKGVTVDGNRMTFDAGRAFPPPHLQGPLVFARLEEGAIRLRWGSAKNLSPRARDELPGASGTNFIQHWGGTLDSGKLTVHGADQILRDADPTDIFDYSQPRFAKEQLPASKIRVDANGRTTMEVPDLDEVEARRTGGSVSP